MSALGQKQTYALQQAMSALHPIATAKADLRKKPCPLYPRKRTCAVQLAHVCFVPRADIDLHYSITASACASSVGGTMTPRALAVLRFITSSYLVGACTGRSAGFSPLRIRST